MSKSEDILFNSEVVPYRILVLCVGNTCRSIIYESILKERRRVNIEITSAGFKSKKREVSKNTKTILKEKEVKLSKERSQNIEEIRKDINYDEVIILDKRYSEKDIKGIKYNRLFIFDILDPFGKEEETYREVYQEIIELMGK